MSLSVLSRSPKVRRAFALASVVLATGGLVLYKAPSSSAYPIDPLTQTQLPPLSANGKNSVAFAGPGAHGVLALSHNKLLSGSTNQVFAEVRLTADADGQAKVRAPISLAVVLDTSGSMSGEKIEDAKRSVLRLLGDMRDEDEIAMVRYSSESELMQPLARVGNVRSLLENRIKNLRADGGTNIPEGLRSGLKSLDEASRGRVKRIVLVSDGLDGTRTQAEALARSSFMSGITVSSLGIGNDFDESYMGAVAQSGHGNFAFIKEGASLAAFLKRELEESASTTIENARVEITLPRGMRFVSATGADATTNGETVELRFGALFAGDEQRAIVELTSDGSSGNITANAQWNKAGGGDARRTTIPQISLLASNDPADVATNRDGAVFASATSVLASKRQLDAANAYARGDIQTATTLTAQNEAALAVAATAAPPAAAPAIRAQMDAYTEQKKGFATVQHASPAGKSMAKSAAAKDTGNLRRAASF